MLLINIVEKPVYNCLVFDSVQNKKKEKICSRLKEFLALVREKTNMNQLTNKKKNI